MIEKKVEILILQLENNFIKNQLCVVLNAISGFFLLTGFHPHHPEASSQNLLNIMDKTFPDPTKICPNIENLLLLIPDLERCNALRPWGRVDGKEG